MTDKPNRFVAEVGDTSPAGRIIETITTTVRPVDSKDDAAASATASVPPFRIVPYEELNARQKELRNFHQAAAILAEYGFNSIKLSDDWRGADFLAVHKDGEQMLRVQLKAGLTIDQKYANKDLFMMFPVKRDWYLIEHVELVKKVGSTTGWLLTRSWLEKGNYYTTAPSKRLLAALKPHCFGTIKVAIASGDG